MNTKNDLEVIINNKRYTISGYENVEYLQKIASHINSKYNLFKSQPGYNHLEAELRNVLMQINLADDYYKANRQKAELEAELERKERELFEMKHLLVDIQAENDKMTQKLAECTQQYNDAKIRIIQLESKR